MVNAEIKVPKKPGDYLVFDQDDGKFKIGTFESDGNWLLERSTLQGTKLWYVRDIYSLFWQKLPRKPV